MADTPLVRVLVAADARGPTALAARRRRAEHQLCAGGNRIRFPFASGLGVDLTSACWSQFCRIWRFRQRLALIARRTTLSLTVRGLTSVVAWAAASAALVFASGCGSSSAPADSSSPAKAPADVAAAGPTVVGGVSVRSVERALLAHGGPPAPTTAACHASSSAERARGPFGHTRRPLFTCELTVSGERTSYVVQVLRNGCFIAERHRRGRAVYGCGADRS